jgi:hypothetical protein
MYSQNAASSSWISCKWVQMEVAHPLPNQSCSHMVDVMVRCQHSSFQTHPCNLCIKTRSHVVVVQHLLQEVHK